MLHAVCPSLNLNFKSRAIPGHISFTRFDSRFISSTWHAADLCSPIYHDTCLMPYASRSRPYPNERINYKIKNFTLRSSDLLICLARLPCERGVTVTHCVTHFSDRGMCGGLLLVVAWFAHAQSSKIFSSLENITQSVFYHAKPGSNPRFIIVNKSLYFRIKSVTRYLLCTAVY